MISEWMKVMLDEIARKNRQAEQDEEEAERRRAENGDLAPRPAGGPPC